MKTRAENSGRFSNAGTMGRLVWALLGICLLASCTHSTHFVHTSDFSPTYRAYAQGELVTAKADQFVVMGFVGQTDFVDQAYRELMSKCPGEIQGITTQYQTHHGFFSWTNEVLVQGLCIHGGRPN